MTDVEEIRKRHASCEKAFALASSPKRRTRIHKDRGILLGLLASHWKPIESAPKDGSIFRAGHFWDPGKFSQYDCFYGVKSHVCGEMGECCDSDWHFNTEGQQDKRFRCAMFEEPMKPTHWQPLPPPPAAGNGG